MTDSRACVLGCANADKIPFRAAPGLLVCNPCSTELAAVLAEIGQTYAMLTEIAELIPGGSRDGGGPRSVPGSRSPAVDALLVLTDTRTTGTDLPGALGAVEQWARRVRADLSIDVPPEQMRSTVPAGRVTMNRELATLRFHWHWICAQDWIDEFADRMRALLAAMRHVGRLNPTQLQIGLCPQLAVRVTVPETEQTVDVLCSARLRVRVGDTEIRCPACGKTWPRDQWRSQLGDPWTDYATLSAEWGVLVGTLRVWCSRDGWQVAGTRSRRRVLRADAQTSYAKYKGGHGALGETG